jgi:hypothetical protein
MTAKTWKAKIAPICNSPCRTSHPPYQTISRLVAGIMKPHTAPSVSSTRSAKSDLRMVVW